MNDWDFVGGFSRVRVGECVRGIYWARLWGSKVTVIRLDEFADSDFQGVPDQVLVLIFVDCFV